MPTVSPSSGISSASEGTGVRGSSVAAGTDTGATANQFAPVMASALVSSGSVDSQAASEPAGPAARVSTAQRASSSEQNAGTLGAEESTGTEARSATRPASGASGAITPDTKAGGSQGAAGAVAKKMPVSGTLARIADAQNEAAETGAAQAGTAGAEAVAITTDKDDSKADTASAAAASVSGSKTDAKTDGKKKQAEGSVVAGTATAAGSVGAAVAQAALAGAGVLQASTTAAANVAESSSGKAASTVIPNGNSSGKSATVIAGKVVTPQSTKTVADNSTSAAGAKAAAIQNAVEGKNPAQPEDADSAAVDGVSGVASMKSTGIAGTTLQAASATATAVASGLSIAAVKPENKPESSRAADASTLNATVTGASLLHAGAAAVHAAGDGSQSSSTPSQTNGVPVTSNPYTRLDEASAPTVLHASPQRMTVAMSDSSLGNLQVQAQTVNGQVAASLATATAAGHAQLSGHLASLTGFLHDQHVDVARVTLAPPAFSSGMSGGQSSAQSGSGGQTQQGQTYSQPAAGFEPALTATSVSAPSSAVASSHSGVASTGYAQGISYIDIHA